MEKINYKFVRDGMFYFDCPDCKTRWGSSTMQTKCTKCESIAIGAEHERLNGVIPYGVCFQFSLTTLRSLKNEAEAAELYKKWLNTDNVAVSHTTDLQLGVK